MPIMTPVMATVLFITTHKKVDLLTKSRKLKSTGSGPPGPIFCSLTKQPQKEEFTPRKIKNPQAWPIVGLRLGIWGISKSGTACDNPTHASSLSPDDDHDHHHHDGDSDFLSHKFIKFS